MRTQTKAMLQLERFLYRYPDIDMEPLFQWDAEGEQTLKALPYVINWFERAIEAIPHHQLEFNIEERTLSAIFQFANVMPWLFVPTTFHKELGAITRKGCEHCGCSCILM